MSKRKDKRKLTAQERARRDWKRANFATIFVRGKQKRVRRTIDGFEPDVFAALLADPLALHHKEMWEYIDVAMGDDDDRDSDMTDDDYPPF